MMSQKASQNNRQTIQIEEQESLPPLEIMGGEPYNNAALHADGPHSDQSRVAGAAGLAVILGQVVTYFNGRAQVDDMDGLGFSLHHLFCRIDMLYRFTLPDALNGSTPSGERERSVEEFIQDQRIWTNLRAIKHALERMEPLCHLLSQATESMLDALDGSCRKAKTPIVGMEEQDWLHSLNTLSQERWEMALVAITESLEQWQESHSHLIPFTTQFINVAASIPTLPQLDSAFTIILDSAGAMFGDIMPGFQAIAAEDDEAVATLLFDLLQQSDQLLAQCDRIVEPLQALIEYFALGTQNS